MPPRPVVPHPDPRIDVLQQQVAEISTQLAQLVPLLTQQAARDRHEPRAGDQRAPRVASPPNSSDDEITVDNPFAPLGRRGDDDRHWESSFKIDLPEFNENMDPDEFLDWIGSLRWKKFFPIKRFLLSVVCLWFVLDSGDVLLRGGKN